MYKFSNRSLERLKGVHPELAEAVKMVMSWQVMDFSVNEGVRTKERQLDLYNRRPVPATRTLKSKHLVQEDGYGHAVDLYPYPIDMKRVRQGDAREIYRFGVLAGLMEAAAIQLGIEITNGADWDDDGQTLDHTFFDAPHFQLSKE